MLRKSLGKLWALVFLHPWLQSTKTGQSTVKEWKMLTAQRIRAQSFCFFAQTEAIYNTCIKIILRKSLGKVWALVFLHPWLQSTKPGQSTVKEWKMLTAQWILAQTLCVFAQTWATYNNSWMKLRLWKSLKAKVVRDYKGWLAARTTFFFLVPAQKMCLKGNFSSVVQFSPVIFLCFWVIPLSENCSKDSSDPPSRIPPALFFKSLGILGNKRG